MIRISAGTTNAYLLESGAGWLLVDSGYDRDEQRFLRVLEGVGVEPGDIAYLLLTHHHDDHAGLVERLTTLEPSIRVITHERSVPLLKKGHNDLDHGGYWLNGRVRFLARIKKWVTPAWDLTFPPYHVRDQDIVIRAEVDETTLRGLGVDATIVATPGHTVDSISVVSADGEALVGDAAASFLGFAGTRHCVVFVTDLEAYYASWKALIDRGVRRVLPSHGAPFPIEVLAADLGRNPVDALVPFRGL